MSDYADRLKVRYDRIEKERNELKEKLESNWLFIEIGEIDKENVKLRKQIERLRKENERMKGWKPEDVLENEIDKLKAKLEEANHILMDIPSSSNPDLEIRRLRDRVAELEGKLEEYYDQETLRLITGENDDS